MFILILGEFFFKGYGGKSFRKIECFFFFKDDDRLKINFWRKI